MKLMISYTALIACAIFFSFSVGASAQKATDQLSGDPRGGYGIIKQNIKADWDHKVLGLDGSDASGSYVPLSTCQSGETAYVVEGKLRNTLVDLAFYIVIAEALLKQYEYPESVWRAPLDEFEEQQLQRIRNGFRVGQDAYAMDAHESLSQNINRNISNAGLGLKPTIARAECGGPANKFTIAIVPVDAKAQLILELYYKYCRQIGLDPSDEQACDLWHAPISNGEKVSLGGTYRYRMVINGRRSSIELLDADRFTDGDTVELPR
jgi:hypothetical protein